jgi:hypothetical protein
MVVDPLHRPAFALASDSMQLSRTAADRLLWSFIALSTPIFALFTYNSGYGYDALEYLIIGAR